jgi:hypothetical protein
MGCRGLRSRCPLSFKKPTWERIRTDVLTDPTITDAEIKLIGYLVTKPPGWIVRPTDIERALNRKPHWVKQTMAKLRHRGLIPSQPRYENGRYAETIYRFDRSAVTVGGNTVGGFAVDGETSALYTTNVIETTDVIETTKSTVDGQTFNGGNSPDAKASVSGLPASAKRPSKPTRPPSLRSKADDEGQSPSAYSVTDDVSSADDLVHGSYRLARLPGDDFACYYCGKIKCKINERNKPKNPWS